MVLSSFAKQIAERIGRLVKDAERREPAIGLDADKQPRIATVGFAQPASEVIC